MGQPFPPGTLKRARSLGAGLILLLAQACTSTSSPTHGSTAIVPLAITAPASLTLPVPAGGSGPVYAGTLTVSVLRGGVFAGPVQLSVSGLPANTAAAFAQPTTSAGADALSIQAGLPDPTDPTFTRKLYPAQGSYPLTVTATGAGGLSATTGVTLVLGPETVDFALSFVTPAGTPSPLTDLTVTGTGPLTENLLAHYLTTATWASPGPVAMSVQGPPAGLRVTFDATPFALTDTTPHVVTFTPQASLAAGTYAFTLTATCNRIARVLPVVVTYSPAPFFLQPLFNAAGVSVVQGGSLAFPLYLGHGDAFFGSVEPPAGTDPAYVGDTFLTATGLPAGLTLSFGAGDDLADPRGLASVPVLITAGAGVPAGPYEITLQATRSYAATSQVDAPAFTLPVTVTSNVLGGFPTSWIQAVEWGQTAVAPGLPLVAGKPALLSVQLMADQPGLPGSVTATLPDGTVYTLAGPAMVPTAVTEGDLPTATLPASTVYTTLIPAAEVTAALTVTLQGTDLAPVTLAPLVRPGYVLPLTVVPIVYQGVQPVLPGDLAMSQALQAFWPLKGVLVTHRAPYTTATVIPAPGASPEDAAAGWGELLGELATLRLVDGATANYYGFFDLGLTADQLPSLAGLSALGEGVGLGVDETAAAVFPDHDPDLDPAVAVLVHEEGHAFNLNHAPAGGGLLPQLNYPYLGAAIGTWGFNPATQVSFNPATTFDIMSYAPAQHWVSDWDYLAAMGWLAGEAATPLQLTASAEQWVVSGSVDPAGQVRVQPLLRVVCPPRPPVPGAFQLVLRTSGGDRVVPFAAAQVADLPEGQRHFTFTVPADGELQGLAVLAGGAQVFAREAATAGTARRRALAAGAEAGTLVVQEAQGRLHLAWDAALHPYVAVFHEGARRTTLALHLKGGSADLSLDGLPEGGRFLVHYSDGLDPVVLAWDR